MPEPFRMYNTLSRKVEAFTPHEPGRASIYACGMTVYDHAHVGHARAFVVFDMVTRYLQHRGWDVTFVRNYTDVDDKIIDRATKLGEDPMELAQRFIDDFQRDADQLGLLRPTHEPRVTERMSDIIAMVETLVARGHAYEAEGSVWFSVETCPDYGKLSGQKMAEVRSADPGGGKRAAQDFALWKGAKPGEPAWDSPWGPGRPGWHIECSAMAYHHLGTAMDIHGGGLDLVFPHHENEIAQSECALGVKPYARYWMHNGLLTMKTGAKMGKSEGNAFNVRETLDLFPAEALRLYYLQVHYRSPLPWSVDALPEALALLARLYEAREVAETMRGEDAVDRIVNDLGADARDVLDLAERFPARLYEAMDDDFNSAKAVGFACELARAVNRLSNHKKAAKRAGPIARRAIAAFDLVRDALGLLQQTSDAFQDEVKDKRLPTLGLDRDQVEAALAERRQARADKRFEDADSIRGDLEGRGVMVMDLPDRTAWRVRLDTAS
jgi:cysteinyl-tRNA synthetase